MGIDFDCNEEILITTGVSEAVDLAFRATLNPARGSEVPEPCHVAYTPDIILAGGVPKTVPTRLAQRVSSPGGGCRQKSDREDLQPSLELSQQPHRCYNDPLGPGGSG